MYFKMSWDSYIDDLIARSKDYTGKVHIDRATIFALNGGEIWTSSHGNALKTERSECALIAKCFSVDDFTAFMFNGVRLEDIHYMLLRIVDGKLVLAKKAGAGTVTLRASKTAIIAAHSPEGCQQPHAIEAVGLIADYLEKMDL